MLDLGSSGAPGVGAAAAGVSPARAGKGHGKGGAADAFASMLDAVAARRGGASAHGAHGTASTGLDSALLDQLASQLASDGQSGPIDGSDGTDAAGAAVNAIDGTVAAVGLGVSQDVDAAQAAKALQAILDLLNQQTSSSSAKEDGSRDTSGRARDNSSRTATRAETTSAANTDPATTAWVAPDVDKSVKSAIVVALSGEASGETTTPSASSAPAAPATAASSDQASSPLRASSTPSDPTARTSWVALRAAGQMPATATGESPATARGGDGQSNQTTSDPGARFDQSVRDLLSQAAARAAHAEAASATGDGSRAAGANTDAAATRSFAASADQAASSRPTGESAASGRTSIASLLTGAVDRRDSAGTAGGTLAGAAARAMAMHATPDVLAPSVATLRAVTAPFQVSGAGADDVATHIVQTIQLQAIQGGGEAIIRLEPSHFGELSVAVRVEGGEVVARLEAAQPAVREWLQANQMSLRQGLADHSLTLSRLEVAAPPSDGRHSSQPQGQHANRQGQPRRQPRKPTDPTFELDA